MPIDEAIKYLKSLAERPEFKLSIVYRNACKLGSEALKQVKQDRAMYPGFEAKILPGETKD